MLIGFLLPLLRRFSARSRMLIAAAVVVAGVVAAALALQGHAHRGNALPIRFGLFVALAGLVLFVSGVRASRRENRRQGVDAEQASDQP